MQESPTILQSRRDCVPQPRVARNELPWVSGPQDFSTPTGLCHVLAAVPQPRWGCSPFASMSQGSSFLATLGYVAESLWDSSPEFPKGIVVRGCSKFQRMAVRPVT